ncbi:hypothetical protein [Pseudomonas sp. NA-150]|uniref:hypothetical protein n=1 Tax=Pseudomonas sp. NA-150 TaxID=3367525 RepID=UPI0037C6EC07
MSNTAQSAAREGWNNLRDTVRPVLINELAAWNIDPDAVYINGVAPDGVVIYCQSLTDEAVTHILNQYEPDYSSAAHMGLFSVAYSFDDAHRVTGPYFVKIGNVMRSLVRAYS